MAMGSEKPEGISEIFRQRKPIDEALNAAVRDAVLRHKQQGQPLAVWRDGKTVWIRPEEVAVGGRLKSEPDVER
jgi:hypothetical protein